MGPMSRFERMYEFSGITDYEPVASASMAARAAAADKDAAAFTYDLLIEGDGQALLYVPAANYHGNSTAAIETMLASKDTVLGLGDGGAHCGIVCDASMPTYTLHRWADIAPGEGRDAYRAGHQGADP